MYRSDLLWYSSVDISAAAAAAGFPDATSRARLVVVNGRRRVLY